MSLQGSCLDKTEEADRDVEGQTHFMCRDAELPDWLSASRPYKKTTLLFISHVLIYFTCLFIIAGPAASSQPPPADGCSSGLL